MEFENSEMLVSKRCKVVNNVAPPPVKFMNLIQSFTGIRNGIIKNGDFPEWLLIELLVRLSTKDVYTSKIVSKQWLSIISDPSFVREYISRRASLSQPWTFISYHLHHEKGSRCLHFPGFELIRNIYSQVNTEPGYFVLPLPSTQQSNDGVNSYMVCGVSNGLVLYRSRARGNVLNYYICNPVTGHWIPLPKFKWSFPDESIGFLTRVEDGILINYRVVRLELLRKRRKILRFDVFSSETGKWKKFILPMNLHKWQFLPSVATAANGVLYWTVNKLGIIVYDPCRSPEQLHTIPLPADIMDHAYFTMLRAGDYEGKLRFFEISPYSENQTSSFKLWELNDPISGDWSLQHSVRSMDIKYIYDANPAFERSCITPLSFHPFDLDVVYFWWDNALVSYNMGTERLEVQQKYCKKKEEAPDGGRFELWWPLLLVIPSWPTSIR